MVLQAINEKFDEDEMKLLKEAKKDLTWREFILSAAKKKVN